MTTTALARAQAGDGEAFRELTDPYRRELQLHCYRIVGSVQDAEDTLQETLLAAWRGLGKFEERASMRSWLYKIATNRCLNVLRDTGRRPAAAARYQWPAPPPEPTRRTEPLWLQPYPDALLEDLHHRGGRAAGRLSDQQVDVLRHDHESMQEITTQEITTLLPVMEERIYEQLGVCCSNEQSAALISGRGQCVSGHEVRVTAYIRA